MMTGSRDSGERSRSVQVSARTAGSRRALAVVTVVLSLVAAGCARQSFGSGGSLDAFSNHLDSRVPRLMHRYSVPGVSMALVREGQPVWLRAYGYADLESGRPMNVEAVCRAESISKSVTAWGVMKLVEEGLIGLDDPVQGYLGDWQLPQTEYSEEGVTVRRLLSGNAGMPLGTIGKAAEYEPGSAMPSLRDYLEREARLTRAPGSGFVYSNPGFNLLELLVEEVTGRRFAEYMAEEILAPLGMEDSSYAWSRELQSSVPTGYELDGTPVPPYVYPVNASGGLLAPVGDIARFAGAGIKGASGGGPLVLAPETVRTIYAPQVPIPGMFGLVADAYGFGHFVETLPDGRRAVWHGGQGHGWMTHFHSIPEAGVAIVILTNSQRSWPFMAEVLKDWARWAGVGPVKFARITHATAVSRAVVGVLVVTLAWLAYRMVRGLVRGGRRFAPFSRQSLGVRVLLAVVGLGGIAALAWSAAQPYLFVTSIFPGTAEWAGGLLLALALLLVVFALFPRGAARPENT